MCSRAAASPPRCCSKVTTTPRWKPIAARARAARRAVRGDSAEEPRCSWAPNSSNGKSPRHWRAPRWPSILSTNPTCRKARTIPLEFWMPFRVPERCRWARRVWWTRASSSMPMAPCAAPFLPCNSPPRCALFFPSGALTTTSRILAYVARDAANGAELDALRATLGERLGLPVLLGYGPRYMHSIGQLYKGGPVSGMFLMITSREARGPADSRREVYVWPVGNGAGPGRPGVARQAGQAGAAASPHRGRSRGFGRACDVRSNRCSPPRARQFEKVMLVNSRSRGTETIRTNRLLADRLTHDNIAALFWDLGGVVLSNGWDESARAEAARRFSLDACRFRAKASARGGRV